MTFTVSALLAYLAGSFLFLSGLARLGRALSTAGLVSVWLGLVLHLVSLGSEAANVGAAALLAMPTGLSLAAFLLVGGYLALERIYEVRQVGYLVAPLAVIALAAVLWSEPSASEEAVGFDVLLKAHVSLAFLGTASFALAFFLALLYAVQNRQLKEKHFGALFRGLPSLDKLDEVGFRCVSVGFPLYTAAILLGFLRAASGEGFSRTVMVLAVVTWLLYGLVLQARITAGWRGSKAASITIAGFLSAVGVIVVYLVR